MKNEKEMSLIQEITADCPILFDMIGRPANETCIGFGFECGEGWHEAIGNACRELEFLNMQYYPKYRVRIQADQIKEKYSELRFYYSVVQDPNRIITWIARRFRYINEYFGNWKKFDYKLKKIIDNEPFDYDITNEISKDEYERDTAGTVKCSNVSYRIENEKYYKIIKCHNYGKCHYKPTRYRLFWHIMNISAYIYHRLMRLTQNDNRYIRNCKYAMDTLAGEIIKRAEKECGNTCEKCGHQIGSEWSPVCMTTGWFTRLCEHCAEKHNGKYTKNGELWSGTTLLKTKEEMLKRYENKEN